MMTGKEGELLSQLRPHEHFLPYMLDMAYLTPPNDLSIFFPFVTFSSVEGMQLLREK